MNILLVTEPFVSLRQPFRGGTETFVVQLADQLTSQGHQVDILAKDADEQHDFQLLETTSSVYGMQDSYRTEDAGQEYYRAFQFGLLDTSRYDIIHYNSFIPEIYTMGALHDVPSVLTLHLPVYERDALQHRLFMQRSGAVAVSTSQRMQQDWQAALGSETTLISNGIDLAQWPLQPSTPDGYLLWCGRITADKNPVGAIQLAKHLQWPLKLAGPVFDQAYFDDQVQPLLDEHRTYVGHVDQDGIRQLAGGASVCLATATWREPFGLGTLEMLASGVPVVGFDSAMPPELRHETCAVAVDSTDWHDLTQLVQKVQNAGGETCRQVAEAFSMAKTAAAYVALYERLAKR